MQFLTQIEGNSLGPLRFDDVAILVVDEILPAVDIGLGQLGAEIASGADANTAVRLVQWLGREERAEPIVGIAAVPRGGVGDLDALRKIRDERPKAAIAVADPHGHFPRIAVRLEQRDLARPQAVFVFEDLVVGNLVGRRHHAVDA